MRLVLIVNPASGSQKQTKMLPIVQAWFKNHGHQLETVFTTGPGNAEILARQAADTGEFDCIVAAGGDGTINEVINGLAGSTIPLGILPWGTTNVFSIEMGFPRTLLAQCRTIHRMNQARLDLGRANGRAFLLMASVGFDAYALHHVGTLKSSIGPLAYMVAAIRSLMRYKLPQFVVSWNGFSHHATFVAVGNTSRYGGLFSFTPKAHPGDGLLDAYLYRERGRLRMVKVIASLLLSWLQPNARRRRRFLYLREAIVRTRQLRIESESPAWFQLDGDVHGRLPLDLTCDAGAITVIVPRRALLTLGPRVYLPT